jgi:hypothetical protein
MIGHRKLRQLDVEMVKWEIDEFHSLHTTPSMTVIMPKDHLLYIWTKSSKYHFSGHPRTP